MALGDSQGTREEGDPVGVGAQGDDAFFGNRRPLFGNTQNNAWGTALGVASGGFFGSDPIGGFVNNLFGTPNVGNVQFDPAATQTPFGQFSMQDGVANIQAAPAIQQAMGGLFSGGAQLVEQGVGSATQDFSGLRDEQLSILRELAQPAEEQAAASTASRLFSGGALGSTGGANMMQALQESQNTADLQRQLQAINLAQQQQNMGLQQAQLGAGLFGRGMDIGMAPMSAADIGLEIGRQRADIAAGNEERFLSGKQGSQGMLGDVAGSVLGSLGGAFSDERLKSNVVDRDTGKVTKEQVDGLRAVDFDMFGQRQSGVIAQDLEKVGLGDLVREHESGYKMVDYGELTARLVSSLKEAYANG